MVKVIGLSGIAGSGKDLFCEMLKERLPDLKPERFALADELKKEVRKWILSSYGIDILKCTREEKESVREFLVFHGNFRRSKSNGQHWTSILKKKIDDSFTYKETSLAVVTDIRYDIYPEDELSWLKNKMGGVLVHISTYSVEPECDDPTCLQYRTDELEHRHFPPAPNPQEKENDPKLKAQADYVLEWPKQKGTMEEIKAGLREYADNFISWLQNSKRL